MRKVNGRFWILALLVETGFAVAPAAADAVRFADINTTNVTPDSLAADSAVVLGDSVVFGLTATKEDRELLYRSDGTAAGTVLIQNLAPGVSNTIAEMVRLGSGSSDMKELAPAAIERTCVPCPVASLNAHCPALSSAGSQDCSRSWSSVPRTRSRPSKVRKSGWLRSIPES